MANDKNQHFVPQCYLRRFAADGEGKSINLYNIDLDRLISKASIRGQCSKDYFYGKHAQLAKAIKASEDGYGEVVNCIFRPGYRLTDSHRLFLKRFWLLQHLRTEAASRRSMEMSRDLHAVGDPTGSFRLKVRDAVQMAMLAFAESIDIVSDLKICLIRNRSLTPFITSDDPAVLTNRWLLNGHKKAGLSFGLRSAGNILLLPISPTILCLGYDGDVHSVPHDGGWVDLRHETDADAFNQHQYLHCRANVFLQDAAHFEAIREAFIRVRELRPVTRHRSYYAVFDGTDGEHSRYVVVDHVPIDAQKDVLVHSQVAHACPATWPRQISWRPDAFGFHNGTRLGYVRRAFASRSDTRPFRKVPRSP